MPASKLPKCPRCRRIARGNTNYEKVVDGKLAKCGYCFHDFEAWEALKVICDNCGWPSAKHFSAGPGLPYSEPSVCPGTKMVPTPCFENRPGTRFKAITEPGSAG